MRKIISAYTEEEMLLLSEEATKRGMALPELQKYALLLLLPVNKPSVYSSTELSEYMFRTLDEMEKNTHFIISSLLPPDIWTSLTSKEKKSLAMELYHYVKKNPDIVEKAGELPGKITQYRKKGVNS